MYARNNMNKSAFTLTELLVVVVIIGVLSSVVLPKFTKVIETHKTLEAEHVMRVVRAEQEARCSADKDYTTNTAQLISWPKGTSKNFTYTLDSDGMLAISLDRDYSLKMKSYLDGGICCTGEYCDSLNKSYPSCDSYVARENTSCVGYEVPAEKDPTPDPEPEPEPEPTPTGCSNDHYEGESAGTSTCGCGTLKLEWHCNSSNVWMINATCELPEGYSNECKPGATETKPCEGGGGTLTHTCSNKCAWGAWTGTCSCEHGTRADGTCKQPVYAYRLMTKGNVKIPACSVSGNSGMTSANCEEGRCPDGHTITYISGQRACYPHDGTAYSCYHNATLSTENNQYYCSYTNAAWEQYVAGYQ